ncbi:MAG: threonine-phosphate decarboxylase CobD [Pseudomonadota bacterium]
MTLAHGGDRAEAARIGGTPCWLDLSTGINPHAYPVTLTPGDWTALPQPSALTALLRAARAAYGVPDAAAIVAAPGTQLLLQLLPIVCPQRAIAIVAPTYGEHGATWRASGAVVRHVPAPIAGESLVVVNPNNPDGQRHDPQSLKTLGAIAQEAGHILVVDEAFCDVDPALSVAGAPGTIVLKSFGKFFGLAGLRLGFAIGAPAPIGRLEAALGPWAVSGPALSVGARALADHAWQAAMRTQLRHERAALDATLSKAGLSVVGGTDLFRLIETPDAASLQRGLARRGVFTRAFPEHPSWLRFGLPGDDAAHFAATLLEAAQEA